MTSSGDLVSAKTCSEFPLIIASGDINKQDDASEFQAILKIMAKRRSGEAHSAQERLSGHYPI